MGEERRGRRQDFKLRETPKNEPPRPARCRQFSTWNLQCVRNLGVLIVLSHGVMTAVIGWKLPT